MISLLEIIKKTTEFFEQRGIEHPRLNAELIFSQVLGCRRLDLYLQFDRPLDGPILDKARPLVKRRAAREPLQYVLGTVDFFNVTLKTDRRALIPRPETEELVEWLTQNINPEPTSILDLGTGTGAIALALASHWKKAIVTAVDCAPEALSLARENTEELNLGDRVYVTVSNWYENISGTFDLIVSNPPYLTQGEWEVAEMEIRDYEPLSALVAEKKGLADLDKIMRESFNHLNSQGWLALETGPDQHPYLTRLAGECGYKNTESLSDLSGRSRFFIARR